MATTYADSGNRSFPAMNCRLTGPTPLPPSVVKAITADMISHRSSRFRVILHRMLDRLRPIFGTQAGAILPFTASGTGGLEAAILNGLNPGDRVLAVQIGYFGQRFAEVAHHYGAKVEIVAFPWGQAADPDTLRAALRKFSDLKAVLLTHNETSTGVLNPLPYLAKVVREESDAFLILDAVSSAGGVPIEMDAFGIDIAIAATQKALMGPPGMVLIAVSPRVLERCKNHGSRAYYFDFVRMAQHASEGSTTFTPSLTCVYALSAAMDLIEAEGLDNVYQRHNTLAALCRERLAMMGCSLFADPASTSPTVTSFLVPDPFSAMKVRQALEAEHHVLVSQGRAKWKDSMIRVGHMGYVSEADIVGFCDALALVIARTAQVKSTIQNS